MVDTIQIESPQAQINRARFAGKDFFSFVDDITTRIQVLFVTEFNDFVTSGTGQMLIDIVSWACETLSFYIDRQASESYLATARTRKAVNRLTRQVGYKMHGAVAASVDMSVNLKKVWPFNVPIPVGFQFKGPNNLIFEAVESVTFISGEGPLSVPRVVACSEGTTRTEIFTSNGSRNQIFRLSPGTSKFVAAGSVTVLVAGVEWSIVDLIEFDQTNQVEIDFNSEPTTARFGDGVAGNIPPNGAEVRVVYRATSGRNGLVISDTIKDVAATLVVMFTQIPLTVTNVKPSSGADDEETLASAKVNAPRFFKARGVAVTQEDYVGVSQAYADPIAGAVAVAQAFVARGADDDLTLQGLLTNIRGIALALATAVETQTTILDTSRLDIETQRTAIVADRTMIDSKLDAIVTDPLLPAASGQVPDIRDSAQQIRVLVNTSSVRADEGLAAGTLGLKDAAFNDIKATLGNVEAQILTIITDAGAIEQDVADAKTHTALINTEATAIATAEAAIEAATAAINTQMTTAFEVAIDDECDLIFEHVDGFLADDCKANLVQVPILTRDVDGFLTEPPIALMRSLEAYLEARKEVTQVVEVVSGGPFLVRADILGTIGVKEGFVQATVLSNVRKAIDDLLRVRAFGKSLRLSDIYATIVPDPSTGQKGVDGIAYAVFKITGPVSSIDVNGNLIIQTKQVVTKGTVTLTAEVALP